MYSRGRVFNVPGKLIQTELSLEEQIKGKNRSGGQIEENRSEDRRWIPRKRLGALKLKMGNITVTIV